MSIYAIGDIQGCYQPFLALLAKIKFDPRRDRLWIAGDLVNRGPQSLEVLRHVRDLGSAATVVLGNHDLHALMVDAGAVMPAQDSDLTPLWTAPDRDALLAWLAAQPLLHVENNHALVHAGLLPQWDIPKAQALADEVGEQLRTRRQPFLNQLKGNEPKHWQDDLQGMARWRCIVNAMTRMRFCTPGGEMEFRAKGEPEAAPTGFLPWFEVAAAAWRTHIVLCGHWSALGFRDLGQVLTLDSACVWGGCLSAVRLEDRQLFQVECPQYAQISAYD